jgi:hypothetical protein
MTFNSLSRISPTVRIFGFVIGVIVLMPLLAWFILFVLIPLLSSSKVLSGFELQELIATLAVIIAVFSIVGKLIEHLLVSQFSSERKIHVGVNVIDNYAIINCTIENMGRKRIIPQNVYIFVDVGIEKDNLITFPFCLKHEQGENDCIMGKKCKAGGVNSFPVDILPDEFRDKFHKSINLKHLSTDSVKFIDPGESFSEDAVLNINKPGVYRVIAVWTSVNADCLCFTKQFIIREKQHNTSEEFEQMIKLRNLLPSASKKK